MSDQHVNPDASLAEVRQKQAEESRGRLKVFFGMSAGVGKTYAMLEEARRRAAEGLNVLVGYAEQHIRPDTEALLLGMEILPYQIVEYRGANLKEFDLDGALARSPALVCVDELAHTNAPGLRHEKRWQDVIELLDAGINVYTTVNVQHIESVNDLVERITGVKVRETLPDAILEQADEVELVDIAPEELLERFREGKVYKAEQAERAAKHFFTRGNLIALREMALRMTADRVDAQMRDFRRDNSVSATWPASDRILVCVSPSPLSGRLVRSAKRLAAGLKAPWVAAYVETSGSARLPERDRRRVEQTLRLAEQLGAQVVTLRGERVADEVMAYARSQNVTKLVIGKTERARWRDIVFGSVVDDLIRRSRQIDVHVIRGEAGEPDDEQPRQRPKRPPDWCGYGWAAAVTGAATLVGWPLYHHLGLTNTNVLMIYLLGVLWTASRFSRGAAVLASVFGVMAFDLCFVPPYFTLGVSDQQYIVTFAVMLLTALTISTLTVRIRRQADAARLRERRTQTLLALSRELAAARATEDVVVAILRHVGDVLGRPVVVLVADTSSQLVDRGHSAGLVPLDDKEMGVAQWAYDHGQTAGAGTGTLPAAAGTYLPMKTSRGAVGILGVVFGPTGSTGAFEEWQTLGAFASQAAMAVERAALAEEARAAWERVEAEFLRNTLLSGVSHELRTPLAVITGAASSLIETGDGLSVEAKTDLLDTIYSASERMERLISNLLDMTRLESGGLVLRREWQPLQEVIGTALRHLDRRLRDHSVNTKVPPELPLVKIDAMAIEQVLINLIDNAVEYAPPDSPIEIIAHVSVTGDVIVEVADRGPGLPQGTEKRVFEKFFRAHPVESRRGIGLGLAICKGIVEAHGGGITAVNRAAGGAVLRFTLPHAGEPPLVDASG